VFSTDLPTVSPAEVAAGAAEGWMLLDVRTDEEWATGHIAGAVHIPMHELGGRLDEVADRVVCVCAVGGRSRTRSGQPRRRDLGLGAGRSSGRDVQNLKIRPQRKADWPAHAWEAVRYLR